MFLDDLVGLRIVIVRDWRDVPIRRITTLSKLLRDIAD